MSHHPSDFISHIEVLYNDEKPRNTVDEINGLNADINKGQDGSYVWLRVHRAQAKDQMVNNFWIDVVGDDDGRSDLAKGAGGNYRYIGFSRDSNATHFVTDVGLWRSDDGQDSPPHSWQGISGDINSGRGGDYLYLVWRTEEFKEWKAIP
ncbi:hypothetical protein FBEOM_11205 [Fusarium beomiforme]|uniref:Uncharacterized protein n=1 Tax=Fusarium beomiforme TaxID=44412 RepID=A0A9P5DUL2_9HYPO|nr:hypothetical protein FBEOM_11205 [Fusarium beomiforme]